MPGSTRPAVGDTAPQRHVCENGRMADGVWLVVGVQARESPLWRICLLANSTVVFTCEEVSSTGGQYVAGRIRGMRTRMRPGGFSISAIACPHWRRPSIARQDSPRSSRTTSSAKTSGPGSKRCRYGLDTSLFSVRAWLLSLSVIGSDNENLARSLTARERRIHTNSIRC